MKFKPKKWQIITAIVLLFFIILNPSLKDFREYTGDQYVTKKMNFLVLSVYADGSDNYIGFLLNFVKSPTWGFTYNTVDPPKYDSTATPSDASSIPPHTEYDTAVINRLLKDFSKTKSKPSNTNNRRFPKKNKDPFILDNTYNK